MPCTVCSSMQARPLTPCFAKPLMSTSHEWSCCYNHPPGEPFMARRAHGPLMGIRRPGHTVAGTPSTCRACAASSTAPAAQSTSCSCWRMLSLQARSRACQRSCKPECSRPALQCSRTTCRTATIKCRSMPCCGCAVRTLAVLALAQPYGLDPRKHSASTLHQPHCTAVLVALAGLHGRLAVSTCSTEER